MSLRPVYEGPKGGDGSRMQITRNDFDAGKPPLRYSPPICSRFLQRKVDWPPNFAGRPTWSIGLF